MAVGSAIRWALTSEEAAELRDEYGADLVYPLVEEEREAEGGTPCARASFPWRSVASMSEAFVGGIDSTDPSCMTAAVLAHEVGHNLGLVHDEWSGVPLRPAGGGTSATTANTGPTTRSCPLRVPAPSGTRVPR